MDEWLGGLYHFARFDGVVVPEAVADGGSEVGTDELGEDRVDVDTGNKFAVSLECLRSRCVGPVPPANVCCMAEPAPS